MDFLVKDTSNLILVPELCGFFAIHYIYWIIGVRLIVLSSRMFKFFERSNYMVHSNLYSCSLCSNYNPNSQQCSIRHIHVNKNSIESHRCIKNKDFIRYAFALAPKKFSSVKEFQSKFKKDARGNPLFVLTKRGIEHAVPAGPNVELFSTSNRGVPRILTFQGQREIIWELGFYGAYIEACKFKVPLYYYYFEKNFKGEKDLLKKYIPQNMKFIDYLKQNKFLLVKTFQLYDKISEEHEKYIN